MIRDYHSPERVEDALALLARGAVAVGGATALYTAKSSRDIELVDVTRLGLDQITVDKDKVVIGAGVTLSRLGAAADIPGMPGALLRKAARAVASEPLRNMITVAGNVAGLNYWADLPPVLLALDATVEVRKQGQAPSAHPIAACLEAGKHPWEGGMIAAVTVPLTQAAQVFGYERFVRTVTDYSLATACVTMTRDGALMRNVHLVIGALQARPHRAAKAEAKLEGKAYDAAAVDEAIATLGDLPVAPNFRASPGYRRQLAGVLSRRALMTAYEWARES
ncbi:MAG: FAD binding domain-containing protein [Deltaproteobacteria bacterium]|nr:FAD binding domain-containing protein [Deltaproteobacteria bacterium]